MITRIGIIALFIAAWAAPATAESITFISEQAFGKKTAITAELFIPKGRTKSPAMVLLHGCYGVGPKTLVWNDRLLSWGYVVMMVDSFTKRNVSKGELCTNPYMVSGATRAYDAHSARRYLTSRPEVDAGRIGVIGFSHGGWTIMHLLQNADFPESQGSFQAAVAYYPYCSKMLNNLNAPLLILIGEKDDWCPAKLCLERDPKGESRKEVIVKIYPGAYHGFDRTDRDRIYKGHIIMAHPEARRDAISRTREFLDRYLK